MRNSQVIVAMGLAFTSLLGEVSESHARSGGPDDGYAGQPGGSTCVACHNSFALNSGRGSLVIEGLPERYRPGETYQLTVQLSDPDARRWGFELTVADGNRRRAGSITVTDNRNTQLSDRGGNNLQYLKHTSNGTFRNQAGGAQWSFRWTAPDQDLGEIGFYVAGNASNNNGNTDGDRIYATSALRSAEEPPPPPDEFVLRLAAGWNLVSSPVIPSDPALQALMAPLLEAGALIIIRNVAGQAFSPEGGRLEAWNPLNAYQIKVSRESEVLFSGTYLASDTTFTLSDGWNFLAFPRLDSVHVTEAFEGWGGELVMVKDNWGRVYIPGFRVQQLGYVHPGEAWMVNVAVDAPRNFTWPQVGGQRPQPPSPAPQPRHFAAPAPTGRSMTIIVTAWEERLAEPGRDEFIPEEGDEVAVGDGQGNWFGAAVVAGDTLVLTAWGDDDVTAEAVEGFRADDVVVFRYWSAAADSEYQVEPRLSDAAEVHYADDALAQVTLVRELPNSVTGRAGLPATSALLTLQPNPFNQAAELRFTLSNSSYVRVGVWTLDGRLLEIVRAGNFAAGEHQVVVSARGLPAGVYLVGVETGGRRWHTKAAVLK